MRGTVTIFFCLRDEDDRVEGKVIISGPLCEIFVVTITVAANTALTMGRGLKEVKGRKEVEKGTMSVMNSE